MEIEYRRRRPEGMKYSKASWWKNTGSLLLRNDIINISKNKEVRFGIKCCSILDEGQPKYVSMFYYTK